MKLCQDGIDAVAGAVVALAVVALSALGALAYIILRRRRLQRAAALPVLASDMLLPSCPEPEPTPPPGAVPIFIGDGASGRIVCSASVWPAIELPPTLAQNRKHSRYDTFDIMKTLFINKTGSTAPPNGLLCVVDGKKKNHDALVIDDGDIGPNVIIWMYSKQLWHEKARVPG